MDESRDVVVESMLVSAEGGGDFGDGGEGGGVREEGVEVVDGVIVDLERLAVAL